ncbi:MAG: M15 family metallopeptidase [Cytophagales bacterium]|nr:M15 family metallopeptidase [Cytophagales bacterium]
MRKTNRLPLAIGLLAAFWACRSPQNNAEQQAADTVATEVVAAAPQRETANELPPDTAEKAEKVAKTPLSAAPNLKQMPDSGFVELVTLDSTLVLDMRYATPNNFLKEKVYECDKCLLRKDAALALVRANQALRKQGYRLRLFDCYRPLDVQKKMWKIMPNPSFVGNPYGNGSMHNKGAAVDLTLADSTGRELDLGTPFDFFGREAYHAYTNLPPDVLARRRLLKQTMTAAGFSPITSEWWHYSYSRKNYPVTNFKPECE